LYRMRPPKRSRIDYLRSVWIPLILGCTFLFIMMVVHNHFTKRTERDRVSQFEYPPVEELTIVVQRVLDTHGVAFRGKVFKDLHPTVWNVHVPGDLPIPSLHLALKEGLDQIQAQIQSAKIEPLTGRVSLEIGWQDSCFLRLHFSKADNIRREEGEIALLIDDFGGRWDSLIKDFSALGIHLNASVIPGSKRSLKAVQALRKEGCEVLLHLPMEPENASFHDDGYLIRTGMTEEKIKSIIQKALDELGYVAGVNNHMGSKVTADHDLMVIILRELKKRDLYFIDSRTTAKTVAYDVARDLGIPTAKRDVFIDVENSKEAIRKRIWELAGKAKQNGFSLGIGHCNPLTLEVLQEEIPKIIARGYQFVYISDVVR
jgi:polysaccharide deacetylase 2 family uncharacterized protein YibQ